MKPSRITLSPPSHSRLLLLGGLLLLSPACARRVEAPTPGQRCCIDVNSCLTLLGDSKGHVHDEDARSLPLNRLDPLKRCAARELDTGGSEAHAGLVPLLFHPAPQVRSGAALALSSANFAFSAQTPDAIPALLHAHEKGPPELPLAALVRFDDARAGSALRRYLQEGPTHILPCVGPTLAPLVVEALEAPDITPPVLARGADLLCNLTRKLTPRVRAILRRELARPTLWRSADPSCQQPLPRTCQVVEDACMPYAGSIAHALSGGARKEVYPEFMEALTRDDERLTPLILHYLADTPSPELDAWRARLLESPIPDCRQHALRRIDTPPPQAREVLQALLERGAPWEREGAASLLARFGDDRAIGALLRALDDPHAGVQAAAARALGSLKQKASAALPRLEELAGTHASPHVRLGAAVARLKMTGQWKPPRAYPCPELTKLDGEPGQWELRLRTGQVRLHSFQRPSESPHASGPCAGISTDSFRNGFIPMNQACLVLNPGAKDGHAETWVSEKGRRISLDRWWGVPTPKYSLEFHGKRLVFHGLSHNGVYLGDVSEVARTQQGGWMMRPFAPLPGHPSAHALESRGDLVVMTRDGNPWELGLSHEDFVPMEAWPWSYSEAFGAACNPVVRITRDGQVFDVE